MGTRGFVGFVIDGTEKIAYNHFDSYPSGLGIEVLGWLRKAHLGGARRLAAALRVVDDSTPPTDEDIEKLGGYLNTSVGGQKERPDWYQLLRGTQGKPAAMLDAGAVLDGSTFPADSLFAEWGYIVDFDAETFEAYEGFQKTPHTKGRFAEQQGRDGYYPCALVGSWPLSALPTDEEFLAIEGGDES
jgi:hypothetical protein